MKSTGCGLSRDGLPRSVQRVLGVGEVGSPGMGLVVSHAAGEPANVHVRARPPPTRLRPLGVADDHFHHDGSLLRRLPS